MCYLCSTVLQLHEGVLYLVISKLLATHVANDDKINADPELNNMDRKKHWWCTHHPSLYGLSSQLNIIMSGDMLCTMLYENRERENVGECKRDRK